MPRIGRLSGHALRAAVAALRFPPSRSALVANLRKDLGIAALGSLGPGARGPIWPETKPFQARRDHERRSLELPLPEPGPDVVTARRLTERFAAGDVTPPEVVERIVAAAGRLSRAPSRDPFHAVDGQGALTAARAAEERHRRGEALGPLDGVPIAIKEEVRVQGLPAQAGTSCLSALPSPTDGDPVARLRGAGAPILGTTVMTEFGMSPIGGSMKRILPRNAHADDRLPGGSSSGAGVGVALGLFPVALGADAGGSIRIPAAFNGVFGIKPTLGRISLAGHALPGGTTMVHLGPIGASTEDLALFLEATCMDDGLDLRSAWQPPIAPGGLVAALGRGVKGLKVGVDEREWEAASPSVARLGRAALDRLEAEGAELVPLQIELAPHAAALGVITAGVEALVALRDLRQDHTREFGLDTQLAFLGLAALGPEDYLEAQAIRTVLRQEVAEALGHVDVLALPTTADVAPPIDQKEIDRGFFDPVALEQVSRFVYLANLTGLPAASVPVGVDEGGLPVGLQIVGDAYDEACVLQVVAHLERLGVASIPPSPFRERILPR